MIKKYKEIRIVFEAGKKHINNVYHRNARNKTIKEIAKRPLRFDVINYLLNSLDRDTTYLEIGTRDPKDNFERINSKIKYSVDPGVEYKSNPVDFILTSDEFFDSLRNGQVLSKDFKFDVIFIDGLHLADQVDRDIANSLEFLSEDGFIVMHDCNPPTEWHAREEYEYSLSPANLFWNGSTWKAFAKYRGMKNIYSCCIDTDWGLGVISKKINFGCPNEIENPYFEFKILEENRVAILNLISVDAFYEIIAS